MLVNHLLHPFRFTRLFFLAIEGKPLPAKYVRRLERIARRRGVTVDELWDSVEQDYDGMPMLGGGLAWDEEYEQYDGDLDLDGDYI